MMFLFNAVITKYVACVTKSVLPVSVAICLVGCVSTTASELSGENISPIYVETPSAENMNACLADVMQMKLGTWDYTGVIARMNGTFRTYVTRSVHGETSDGTLSFQSFGGDVYDDSISYSRLVGTQMLPVIDGVQQKTGIQFISCTGPDAEGRYFTSSEYTLPEEEGDTEKFSVKAASTYSSSGSYYSEDIYTESGRIIAQRAGVTLPVKERSDSK